MSTPPTGPRLDAPSPDTRRESIERRILESAQELIDGGVSWNQLGIRQITERADISRTAFYDFFGSKNEVLEHLIRGLYEDLTLAVRDVLDPDALGYFDLTRLSPALVTVAEFARRHGFAYRAFLDATTEDQDLSDLWAEIIDAFSELIARSIEVVRDTHPEAPRTAGAKPLGRTLILMTERCLVADLDPRAIPDRSENLAALLEVWERSVFGHSPIPAA